MSRTPVTPRATGSHLAQDATHVIGVEMCAEAVEDAKLNAQLNSVTNVEFHVGKAEDVLQPVISRLTDRDSVVGIVDPPRAGLRMWV